MTVYVDVFYELGETYRDVTLSCDECLTEGYDTTSAFESRRNAKKDGWLRKRIKGKYVDICPNCQKKEKK